MANAKILALYRYPVKGFSPEAMERVELEAGGTIPFDRAFAIENGPSGFDPAAPAYFQKTRFLMLMRDERMAAFATRLDATTSLFRIFRDGVVQVEGSLATKDGRARIETWIAENFADELRGPPKILSAPGHSFSDMSAKVLHLVNLASVRALEEKLGRALDPMRFRPNIVIDGIPSWRELEWAGAELRLPQMVLAWKTSTARCAAVNVDPATARRDLEIPKTLHSLYGHMDFGIYLTAKTSGTIAVGDEIEVVG